jgi:hypothetical protein
MKYNTFAQGAGIGVRREIFATLLALLILVVAGFSRCLVAQVTVTVSPTLITLATLATQQFTATVTGTTNTAVTWEVNGVAGGNSAAGLISTNGIYLGPSSVPSPASLSVTAVSQADPTKSATATVTVELPSRSGVTYYVATTGSDTNAGTLSAPWRTIQHAANSVHPGDTVEVEGGVYNEIVTIPRSGNATQGYITFMSYPGQTATVDGTGLSVGSSGQTGLFSLVGTHSYIIIEGFEIRNFKSSSRSKVPVGIDFEGAGNYIEILNNHIHNIVQTLGSCSSANALAIALYGNQAPASINNVTLSGNEIDHNTTGCSENVSVDGNVQYFVEANNLVHDGDNIGLDNIGFEGMSPNVNYDQARDGWIFQNTIYNITSTTNRVYHGSLGADGYYCDGCARVIFERNLIHDTDIPIEMASEHSGKVAGYTIARNNVIYHALYVGISIGGYASTVGGTDHCTIVNNTLWDDGTHSGGVGELQIQYHATNNTIENNIMYASTTGYLIYDFTSNTSNPAVLDYNLYYTTVGAGSSLWDWQAKSITGYSSYQSASHMDAHSPFADPQFVNISSTPPNLDILSSSPAVNAGANLGSSVVGLLDYAGNPRVNANGQINIGAYEQ